MNMESEFWLNYFYSINLFTHLLHATCLPLQGVAYFMAHTSMHMNVFADEAETLRRIQNEEDQDTL